jgi:voltage-gated sodium channel
MFIIFYIYAAAGAILFSDINPVLWGDISIAMLTLFRVMVVSVMEDEHRRVAQEQNPEPSNKELLQQIEELKALVQKQ